MMVRDDPAHCQGLGTGTLHDPGRAVEVAARANEQGLGCAGVGHETRVGRELDDRGWTREFFAEARASGDGGVVQPVIPAKRATGRLGSRREVTFGLGMHDTAIRRLEAGVRRVVEDSRNLRICRVTAAGGSCGRARIRRDVGAVTNGRCTS